jgi:two-component system sensor histidine kinase SenX3
MGLATEGSAGSVSRWPWLTRPFLVSALALAVLFGLLLTAVTRLAFNENRLSGELSEGVIWFSSQGQYDAMRLADTVLLFEDGRVPYDEVVLRFDLLDSRVLLFEEGGVYRRAERLGFADEVAELRQIMDANRPLLEALEPGDAEATVAMHDAAITVAHTLRDFANAGMLDGREQQARVQDVRRQILFEVLAFLVATVAAGVLVAFVLLRSHRTMARAEAELKHEREVSRLHRAFTSVVSHQFRTPLSIIDASAQRMVRRGAAMTADEIVSRASKIRNACQRLTRLMESTLNAARLEQGEISFHARPTSLHQLIETVCDGQPEEDQNRIELSIDDLPRRAMADTTLLEQAVQNLVSNALKYSPPSSLVVIRGTRQGTDVVISVEDSGLGIPADEIPFISERFFRARTAEGVPGTGIGLHFVSQIMDLHGGRLEVESTEGKGSTFTLRFPYRPAEQEAQAAFAEGTG